MLVAPLINSPSGIFHSNTNLILFDSLLLFNNLIEDVVTLKKIKINQKLKNKKFFLTDLNNLTKVDIRTV